MKANKEFKDKILICKNCGKKFHPRYSSKGLFCCQECSINYQKQEKYKEYLENPDLYYGKSNIRWLRPHIMEEQDNRCAICGCKPEHNGKPLVFVMDHIDGHANNNKRDNLRCICPNCDSQLDTYKSKNKNGDRVYYHNHHR